jgi:hypothetical protein
MKIMYKIHLAAILLFLAGFSSCDVFDDTANDYRLTILVECSGGSGQAFNFDFVADDYVLSLSGIGQSIVPLENIKTLTVTATKDQDDAAIQIFILKDEKIVQVGFLNANYPSSSSVTNTLTVVWKNTEDKKEETASDKTSSTTKTTTTSTGS